MTADPTSNLPTDALNYINSTNDWFPFWSLQGIWRCLVLDELPFLIVIVQVGLVALQKGVLYDSIILSMYREGSIYRVLLISCPNPHPR